jgi:hypothetical protein
MRNKPSAGHGLSNEPKYVKIGRLEPEFWVGKKLQIASKLNPHDTTLRNWDDSRFLASHNPLSSNDNNNDLLNKHNV